jgi:xanthine dehydrogenase accessory factor
MADFPASPIGSALEWIDAGRKTALATVTRTWGSAPRPTGSQMAVRDDGAFIGSVSGGCVENAVIEEAQSAIADGKDRNLEFGVSNEQAWSVGLACGGMIRVHVAPVETDERKSVLRSIVQAAEASRTAVLASDLESGAWRLIYPDAEKNEQFSAAARDAARRDQARMAEIDGQEWFLNVFNPALELAIVGAVHIAQPLAEMGKRTGYRVRVIDPRTHFASAERFPGVTLVHEWPDEALATRPLGQRSAIVALTHDPKLDDPALGAALRSSAFYIGALGSKKSHAQRIERLKSSGFTDEDIERIHGPVGLPIGARSPAEIAISILAEITAELRSEQKK